jgi:hypothetical protein
MADTRSPFELVLGSVTDELRPAQDWQADERSLLLAMLDLALTNITIAMTNRDKEAATRCLMSAVDTYGSVKSLLPKLGLSAEHVAAIHERLEVVRQRLWTGPMMSADKT